MKVQLIESPALAPSVPKIAERDSLFPWLVFLVDFGNAKLTAIFDEFIDVEQYIAFWADRCPWWVFTAVQADVSFPNWSSCSPERGGPSPLDFDRDNVTAPLPVVKPKPEASAYDNPGKPGAFYVVIKGLSPALIMDKISWHKDAINNLYAKMPKSKKRTQLLMSHYRIIACYEKEYAHAKHIQDRLQGD